MHKFGSIIDKISPSNIKIFKKKKIQFQCILYSNRFMKNILYIKYGNMNTKFESCIALSNHNFFFLNN